jgi:hypothetical protein
VIIRLFKKLAGTPTHRFHYEATAKITSTDECVFAPSMPARAARRKLRLVFQTGAVDDYSKDMTEHSRLTTHEQSSQLQAALM